MRAVQVKEFVAGPQDLQVSDVAEPQPQADEYLVEIRACGANFFDLLQIRGKYQWQPPLPWVGGSEFSGIITAVPSNNKSPRFKTGDKIFGSAQGAFAQKICVKEANLLTVPEGWSFREASALYLTGPTGYAAMVTRARIQPAGGVGLSALQIAKAHGAKVIATSTGGGIDACKLYGADHVIDYARTPAWEKQVMEITKGHGADVVFDPVGMISQSLKCSAFDARLVCIGFVGGEIEAIKINRILLKNVSVVGLHWGAYTEFQPETIPKVWENLFQLIRQGKFRSTVFEERFEGLKDVGRALKTLEDKRSWGKVVIDVEQEKASAKL